MRSDSALVVSSGAVVKASQGSNEHQQCCSLRRRTYNAACADSFSLESNSNRWEKAIKA